MRTTLFMAATIVALANHTQGDIYRWEYIDPADPSQGKQQSTTVAGSIYFPHGLGVDAVPGVNLAGRDLSMAYFIGADLTGANLSSVVTSSGIIDTNPPLLTTDDAPPGSFPFNRFIRFITYRPMNLADADFTGAEIRGTSFSRGSCAPGVHCSDQPQGAGLALEQLYSTASYQNRNLSGINWTRNSFVRANFANQNLAHAVFAQASLANADFTGATLTDADFSGAYLFAADARGARGFDFTTATSTTNLICPDGHIHGLDLSFHDTFLLRDYDGNALLDPATPPVPIVVDQQAVIGAEGTLSMLFEADAWDSTISFAPGIPVTLGGTLALTFADDVNLASQLGRTLKIFDWTGVTPTGAFTVSSPYAWDLSNLYTTGEVTLTAIPEPATVPLALLALTCTLAVARRARSG